MDYIIIGLGIPLAILAFHRPYLGVLVLLITLWFSPLFPGVGLTINRIIGTAVLGGIFTGKMRRIGENYFVISKFDYFFWIYLFIILASILFSGRSEIFNPDGAFCGLIMGYLLYYFMVNTKIIWEAVYRIKVG